VDLVEILHLDLIQMAKTPLFPVTVPFITMRPVAVKVDHTELQRHKMIQLKVDHLVVQVAVAQ
jgi:hypothetical protein